MFGASCTISVPACRPSAIGTLRAARPAIEAANNGCYDNYRSYDCLF